MTPALHAPTSTIVTGASGFIGTRLCRELGGDPRVRLTGVDRVAPSGSEPNCGFVLADVRSREQLVRIAMQPARPVLVHLAAKAEVVLPFPEYADAMSTNVDGTVCVLEALAPRVILFASSSSVYGNTGRLPAQPIWSRVRPLSAYGLSKALGESICSAWASDSGGSALAFRFGNVVGSGCRGLIPYLVQHAVRYPDAAEPARMRGKGRIVRDYVPIEHVVDILVRAVRMDWPIGETAAFNISAGWGLTNKAVAAEVQSVLEAAGYRLRIRYDAAPAAGEAMCAILDATRTAEVFRIDLPREEQVLQSIRDAARSCLRALTLAATRATPAP